ncbi:hypothetical protein Trydic_g11530 [Trypoxylus dichotomus]
MENNDDVVIDQPVSRRTRSGKTIATPKSASKKTRKKVMLVEVEVSDEEEVNSSKAQEDKLNESDRNSFDEEVEESVTDTSKDMPLIEENETSNPTALVSNGQTREEICRVIENDVFICDFENDEQKHVHLEIKQSANADVKIESEVKNDPDEACTTEIIELPDDECGKMDESSSQPVVSEAMEVDQDSADLMGEDEINEKNEESCDEEGIVKMEDDSEESKNEFVIKKEVKEEDSSEESVERLNIHTADPDAENISEDELPTVQVAKVPETEEVSDEELPGPKRAELPADTEVVSEDELPAVKKEGTKRKITEDPDVDKEKEKTEKPKKLPELDKYWKAVNDDPTDFTGWTYLLQYVDQEGDDEQMCNVYFRLI